MQEAQGKQTLQPRAAASQLQLPASTRNHLRRNKIFGFLGWCFQQRHIRVFQAWILNKRGRIPWEPQGLCHYSNKGKISTWRGTFQFAYRWHLNLLGCAFPILIPWNGLPACLAGIIKWQQCRNDNKKIELMPFNSILREISKRLRLDRHRAWRGAWSSSPSRIYWNARGGKAFLVKNFAFPSSAMPPWLHHSQRRNQFPLLSSKG